VFGPTASLLGSAACAISSGAGGCHVALASLASTGTYSFEVQPPAGAKVSGSIQLSGDLTGTLTAGTPQSLNATRPGQVARFTFPARVGDSTSVKLFGAPVSPTSQSVNVSVWRSDGSFVAQGSVGSPTTAALVNLASLPITGTYMVVVEPTYGATWQGQ